MLNRRTLLTTSLAAAVAPRALRAEDTSAYFADLTEKAKKEGELTWYIAHWRVGSPSASQSVSRSSTRRSNATWCARRAR